MPIAVFGYSPEQMSFSPEATEKLIELGFEIYRLESLTIEALRAQGAKFLSTWHQGHDIETHRSRPTQVAVHPEDLYVQGSNNTASAYQYSHIERYKLWLRQLTGREDIDAIKGDLPDYIELVHKSGRPLYRDGYVRTQTLVLKERGVYERPEMGAVFKTFATGFHIKKVPFNLDSGQVWAAPLVVPYMPFPMLARP